MESQILHCPKNVVFIQFSADLVTFTKEILNAKLHFFAVLPVVFDKLIIKVEFYHI